MTGAKKCSPHIWNIDDWLPLYRSNRVEESPPEITCVDCGRVLAVVDTSPNMRSSIAVGIASRLFDGVEYDRVLASVNEYFEYHRENPPPANPYDREPLQDANPNSRTETGLIDKPIIGSLRAACSSRFLRDRNGSGKGQVPESDPRRAGGS